MKKQVLRAATAAAFGLSVGAFTSALAQQSAVTNALLSQKAGQLDKALASINEAIVNEKTKDKAKTWFTRGDIYYQLLDTSMVGKKLFGKYAKALPAGEAQQKAIESFQKALALDGPTGEFGKQTPDRLKNLYIMALNAGVSGYQAKNYDKAVAGFRQAALINPQDTTALLYSAFSQDAKQDLAGAKASYTQLLGLDAYKAKPAPVAVYSRLLQIARDEKNTAEAQQIVRRALVAYPANKTFLIEDLNLAMAAGGGAPALEKLNKTIAADPNNANLYAVRGSFYDIQVKSASTPADKQAKADLAVADYRKAVELDPKNFDAQYNLGVFEFNQAAALYTKTSKMDLKTYQVKGKAIEAEARKHFETAAQYLEKALSLQTGDQASINALSKIYSRLNRPADLARINAMKK